MCPRHKETEDTVQADWRPNHKIKLTMSKSLSREISVLKGLGFIFASCPLLLSKLFVPIMRMATQLFNDIPQNSASFSVAYTGWLWVETQCNYCIMGFCCCSWKLDYLPERLTCPRMGESEHISAFKLFFKRCEAPAERDITDECQVVNITTKRWDKAEDLAKG